MSKYTVKAGMHMFADTLVKVGDTVESKAELDPRLFEKLPEAKADSKAELKAKAKAEADALKAKEKADAKAKADAETKGGAADNAGNFPEGGTGAAGQK